MEGRIVWAIYSEPNMKEMGASAVRSSNQRVVPAPQIAHPPPSFLECPNQGSKKVKSSKRFLKQVSVP